MENLGKEEQELMFKFNLFEQQIRAIQEQLQVLEQTIVETSSLKISLEELKGSKEKEIFASIGKGIFIKAKISADDLIVDVGGKNFVKKTVSETQRIIEVQIDKLEEIRTELEKKLEEINEEITNTFMEAQERAKK
jgi:prefoldin alpha subunit